MKKILYAALIWSMLVLTAAAVWAAPTLKIDDSTTPVNVISTGFINPPNPDSINTEVGYAQIHATLYGTQMVLPATYGVRFLESVNGSVSDFVILAVNWATGTTPNFVQDFTLTFWSGEASGFAAALASYYANSAIHDQTPIIENGDFQSVFVNDPPDIVIPCGLQIAVKSDAAVVPLPGAVLLLGGGLLRLAGYARKRRPVA